MPEGRRKGDARPPPGCLRRKRKTARRTAARPWHGRGAGGGRSDWAWAGSTPQVSARTQITPYPPARLPQTKRSTQARPGRPDCGGAALVCGRGCRGRVPSQAAGRRAGGTGPVAGRRFRAGCGPTATATRRAGSCWRGRRRVCNMRVPRQLWRPAGDGPRAHA